MASALAHSHIEAERRLRNLITGGVERIWRDLPGHDRADIDRWLSQVLPVIDAGRRASTALTDGYLARALERAPLGIDPDVLEIRKGTDLATAYERPFVTVWSALGAGSLYEDAVSSGLARAKEMASFDVQAAMRATAGAVNEADPNVYGFERVADGSACAFCLEIDGAYVKSGDAMSLHPGCGCGLEPLTAPHSRAAKPPSGVAVHEHGEMGAYLGSPDHAFTGPAALT